MSEELRVPGDNLQQYFISVFYLLVKCQLVSSQAKYYDNFPTCGVHGTKVKLTVNVSSLPRILDKKCQIFDCMN